MAWRAIIGVPRLVDGGGEQLREHKIGITAAVTLESIYTCSRVHATHTAAVHIETRARRTSRDTALRRVSRWWWASRCAVVYAAPATVVKEYTHMPMPMPCFGRKSVSVRA